MPGPSGRLCRTLADRRRMLAYFPQIYPHELLYSVLARYHHHLGGTNPGGTMEALFGTRFAIAAVDLPGHLARIQAALDGPHPVGRIGP